MKKYVIFSLVLISLISLFVYMQSNSYTTFNILGVNITLLNALWVLIILFTFFLFSIIFFSITQFKNFFFQKNLKRDINNLIFNIKNRILYKEDSKKIKILDDINSFVNNIEGLSIKPNSVKNFEFLEDINKILNKEVVDLKKYKLDENNPWYIENAKNRLRNGDIKFAKEILKKSTNEELKKEAFKVFALNSKGKEILNLDLDYPLDFEIIKSHLDDFYLNELLKKAKLSAREEIEVAKELYSKKTPDEEFEILKPLKWGSCYLAFRYSHLQKAKELIDEYNLKFFEYPLKLLENNQKVDIDEYINSVI